MTIYKDDIKLFESKVMTDESDGGGAMTGVVIESGKHNSIFPDISDLDRAYGRVNVRSLHYKVDSTENDTYFGATVGLSQTPIDPNVDITLMSVNNPYIERDATQDLIERYLTKGAKYQGELMYDQLVGQRSIRLIQRTNIKPPINGDVIVLKSKKNTDEQYVKVDDVSSENQTFTDSNGTFTRLVVQCVITEPLRYEFKGVSPNRYDPTSSDSAIYEVMVADASKYFGKKKLKVNAEFNKSEFMVESIFSQLVPSTRVDSPHVNINAINLAPAVFDLNGNNETEVITGVESKKIDVTLSNQGYVYTATLVPIPSQGTTKVSFMSQGNWYELQDDGTGVLKGSSEAFGLGRLDEYGNLSLTLGALPDVDVPILVHYQNINNYLKPIANDDLTSENLFTISLGNTPINSELSIMTWGEGKTATIADGNITGDFVGEYIFKEVFHASKPSYGSVSAPPAPVYAYTLQGKFVDIPASDTEFTITWSEQLTPVESKRKASFSVARNIQDGNTLNLPANLPHGSLQLAIEYNCSDTSAFSFKSRTGVGGKPAKDYPYFQPRKVTLLDDGLGNLIAQVTGYPVAGSVNYATGVVTLNQIELPFQKNNWVSEVVGGLIGFTGEYHKAIRVQSVETITKMQRAFDNGQVAYCTGYDESTEPPAIEILAGDLTVGFNNESPLRLNIETETEILTDTLSFTYNGREYENREDSIYYLGREVGSIERLNGEIKLNEWGAGSGDVALIKGVFKTGTLPQAQYSMFRTAGTPVASQSLQVNAKTVGGSNINAVTDANGIISSPTDDFGGHIQTNIGVVELVAGELLDTESIKYNCVSYNYLPLDAEVLGLDPIRLPSDGRVVIFEKGDVIAIHQDEALTETVATGQTLQLNHVRLVTCTTTASDAVVDLDAGTILFPTGGTYDITYRFEDMVLLTYVDISGVLKTSRPISHDYDAEKAHVSSLLIAGDLFARYTNLFDQKTWQGDFKDSLVGDEANAEYNDTLYPIQVTNDGCITERFALVFTNSTNFKLIGENTGQNFSGDINTDFAPINPTSGKPYFVINKLGWGVGWATNNVLRIDFFGAVYQLNAIRTILQGESENPVDSDAFALQIRGNTNKETV